MSGKIKVMVVGSGGREDALVRLAAQSGMVQTVYVAPGNTGMLLRQKAIRLPELKTVEALARFAKDQEVGLTIVGPEAYLASGIVDRFREYGLPIFGPTQEAAKIESSKVWAKKLMNDCGIPTADFWLTRDSESAQKYSKANLPCVIKADGLAGGKGVDICHTKEEVDEAVERIMHGKELKDAGSEVVIEELLTGYEVSFMVLTDGSNVLPLVSAMDHKRVFDGDKGPNTGGMGAVAPVPTITRQVEKRIMQEIVHPLLLGLRNVGAAFQGCFYLGLMITREGPKVLEVNCRPGDPELQAVSMLIKSDVIPVFQAIARGRLNGETLEMSNEASACVVMTSAGYPNAYSKGRPIAGLDRALESPDADVSFAAVALKEGNLVTDGGRVLGVTKRDYSIVRAIEGAYEIVSQIRWDEEHHRKDIGQRIIDIGIQLEMGR